MPRVATARRGDPAADVRPEAGSSASDASDRLDRAGAHDRWRHAADALRRPRRHGQRPWTAPGRASAVLSVPVAALGRAAPSRRAWRMTRRPLTLSVDGAGRGPVRIACSRSRQPRRPRRAASAPTLLTPAPVAGHRVRDAGGVRSRALLRRARRCVSTGNVMVDGSLAAPVCVTPADTLPAAGARRVCGWSQEGASITLDLDRGRRRPTWPATWCCAATAPNGTLAAAHRRPGDGDHLHATRRPGRRATYTYAVVAVDKAGNREPAVAIGRR